MQTWVKHLLFLLSYSYSLFWRNKNQTKWNTSSDAPALLTVAKCQPRHLTAFIALSRGFDRWPDDSNLSIHGTCSNIQLPTVCHPGAECTTAGHNTLSLFYASPLPSGFHCTATESNDYGNETDDLQLRAAAPLGVPANIPERGDKCAQRTVTDRIPEHDPVVPHSLCVCTRCHPGRCLLRDPWLPKERVWSFELAYFGDASIFPGSVQRRGVEVRKQGANVTTDSKKKKKYHTMKQNFVSDHTANYRAGYSYRQAPSLDWTNFANSSAKRSPLVCLLGWFLSAGGYLFLFHALFASPLVSPATTRLACIDNL